MAHIDEEVAEEVLEDYKHRTLQLMPASGRYLKYRAQTEKSINGATSLKLLQDAIDAYLDAIRPSNASNAATSAMEHSETAPIAAFNVIELNLCKVKSEIDEVRGSMVVHEEDEER